MIPLLVLALACNRPASTPGGPAYPHLFVTPADKAAILARVDQEPWASVLQALKDRAARDWIDQPDPAHWDASTYGADASTAQDNAMLAWLFNDPDAAQKAIDFLDRLPTDFDTQDTWDVDIRMADPLIGFANAIDLLRGTPWYPEQDAQAHIDKLVSLNDAFYEGYVQDDVTRQALLGPTQNNHPIRTAAAIGYIALFYPKSDLASEEADWAVSELDYLWGPEGQYVQSDGGVSEGPFYYGFGFAPSIALFIAMDHAIDPSRVYHRDCRNRQHVDPWDGYDCPQGEPFTFDNPLHRADFPATVDWWITLRLPDGNGPPLGDAYFNAFNGGPLLGPYTGDGIYRWNWENNVYSPLEMTHGLDLVPYHLVGVTEDVPPSPPSWTTRFMPAAGDAVFRSGWDPDARWLLLLGEHGSARKTVHDHVDGLSFSMAAYGEYLLLDPGYYKTAELVLPETAQADAHNVILVDGVGAPRKGLLTDWGDTDAFIEHTHDGDRVDYAEARESYQDVDFVRSVAMIRDRWFVVADRLSTTRTDERQFTWRLSGYAGLDSGGSFAIGDGVATWQRPLAGVDVYLQSTASGLVLEEPPYRVHRAPNVHLFDLARDLDDHDVLDGDITAVAPGFLAVLAPYRVSDGTPETGPEGRLQVTPLDLGTGVVAYTVAGDGALDLVLLRDPTAPTSLSLPDGSVVTTDAALAVVSLQGPPVALIARGTSLSLDGTVRVTGAADGAGFAEN